jgi:hypothetical protein
LGGFFGWVFYCQPCLLLLLLLLSTAALVHDLQYPQDGFSSNSKDVADV